VSDGVLPGVQRAARIGRAVTILLAATIVGDLANIGVTIAELATLRRYRDGTASDLEVVRAIDRSGAVGITILVLAVVTGIVWLVWQHRSQSNLREAGIRGLAFTPGWAVGWWLIPIANLWKPFQATRELHKASAGGERWWEAPTPALLGWWWAGWIVFNVMDGVASGFFAGDDVSIGSYMVGDRFSIAGDLLSTATAVLAIIVVREVIRRQATLRSAPVFASDVPPRPDLWDRRLGPAH
jgi:uncharacterized protein DUF4328